MQKRGLLIINVITISLLLILIIREDYPKRIYKKLIIKSEEIEQENRIKKDLKRDYYEKSKFEVCTSLFEIYEKKDCKIAFLGNSITYLCNWSELLDRTDVVNRGIGGQTTKNLLKLSDYVIEINPEYVFIMGGINDFTGGFQMDSVKQNYTQLIEKFTDLNIKPVIQSTLFVAEEFDNSKVINEHVIQLNQFLQKLCEQQNINYLDINKFLSKDGFLITDYTYDGLHLKGNGYQIWKKLLKEFLLETGI